MKVLVTGAAGFLGSHLVDALLIRGFQVIGLDRRDTVNLADARRFRQFTFVRADVTRGDPGEWGTGCDTVYDFVAGSENANGACEIMSMAGHGRKTTLRYSDVYGPRQNPEALIPRIMRAVRTRTPIDLYGEPACVQPLYVSDAVRAALAAVTVEAPQAVVDIAGPHTVDLDELIEVIQAVTGRTVPVMADRSGHAGPAVDLDDTCDLSGYRPRISLPDGLRRYWLTTADPQPCSGRRRSVARFRSNAPRWDTG